MLSEETLQSQCIQWANNTYKELRFWGIMHIPNGGLRTTFDQRKSKALGIRKGFPDLQIILPSGKIFFIEMKKLKGVQSEKQKECQVWLEERGFEYYKIDNREDFEALINRKMNVSVEFSYKLEDLLGQKVAIHCKTKPEWDEVYGICTGAPWASELPDSFNTAFMFDTWPKCFISSIERALKQEMKIIDAQSFLKHNRKYRDDQYC